MTGLLNPKLNRQNAIIVTQQRRHVLRYRYCTCFWLRYYTSFGLNRFLGEGGSITYKWSRQDVLVVFGTFFCCCCMARPWDSLPGQQLFFCSSSSCKEPSKKKRWSFFSCFFLSLAHPIYYYLRDFVLSLSPDLDVAQIQGHKSRLSFHPSPRYCTLP